MLKPFVIAKQRMKSTLPFFSGCMEAKLCKPCTPFPSHPHRSCGMVWYSTLKAQLTSSREPRLSRPNCLVLDRTVSFSTELSRSRPNCDCSRPNCDFLDRTVIVLDRTVITIYGVLSFPSPGGESVRLWLFGTTRHTSAPALPTLSCVSDDRYVYKTLPYAGLFPGARSCAFKS